MLNRQRILTQYPWLRPSADAVGVVMGDDLDAALTTALYLHTHPNARLIGIYRGYETVFYSAASWKEVLHAVWLDLDIYHPACRSLGHHILRLSPQDQLPGLARSCNLNELAGRSVQQDFTQKYPLGTIHFLLWLYRLEIPELPHAELLIWLADSSYINGQAESWHKKRPRGQNPPRWVKGPGFRWNVKRWLYTQIPLQSLQASFQRIDTPDFEEQMERFQQKVMAPAGFQQGNGQVASRRRKLSGYQCQPAKDADIRAYIYRLLRFSCTQTGWQVRLSQLAPFETPRQLSGERKIMPVTAIPEQDLARLLRQRQAFSYVFQSRRYLNYTTEIAPAPPR